MPIGSGRGSSQTEQLAPFSAARRVSEGGVTTDFRGLQIRTSGNSSRRFPSLMRRAPSDRLPTERRQVRASELSPFASRKERLSRSERRRSGPIAPPSQFDIGRPLGRQDPAKQQPEGGRCVETGDEIV